MSEKKKIRHARGSRGRPKRDILRLCGNFTAVDGRAADVMAAAKRISLRSTKDELLRLGTMPESRLEAVEYYYRRHLFLLGYFPHLTGLAPADQVGEFWHVHILETEKYAADCELVCGRFLHHAFDPKPGTDAYAAATEAWRGYVLGVTGRGLPDWFTYAGGRP